MDYQNYWEGYQLYQDGRQEEALSYLNLAIIQNQEVGEYYFMRGLIYYQLELLQNSLQDLNKSIELDEKLDEAYKLRGRVNNQFGRTKEAILDLKKSIDLKLRFPDKDCDLNCVFELRDLIKLEDVYEDLLLINQLKHSDLQVVHHLAIIYDLKEDYEQSSFYWEIYIQSSEQAAEQADKYFRKMVKLHPDSYFYLCMRSFTQIQLKNPELALKLIQKSLELKKEYHLTFKNLALYNKMINQPTKSVEQIQLAIQLNKKCYQAYAIYGDVFVAGGQMREALPYYDLALKNITDKRYFSHLYHKRGKIYKEMSRPVEAIQNFEKVVEYTMNPKEKQKVIALLEEFGSPTQYMPKKKQSVTSLNLKIFK